MIKCKICYHISCLKIPQSPLLNDVNSHFLCGRNNCSNGERVVGKVPEHETNVMADKERDSQHNFLFTLRLIHVSKLPTIDSKAT